MNPLPEPSYKNKKLFAIGLIVIQTIVVIVYAFFLRVQVHNDDASIEYDYPSYMDLIFFVTLAIGFLNTFIRTYMWTGMIHNWLFYTISIQIFFIFQTMWYRAFGKQFLGRNSDDSNWMIDIRQQDYTLAVYSSSVMDMAFGICFGRIGYLQKLIIVVFQMIAYTFNAIIINDVLNVYDVGGSIFCHIFGCYFGLGISLIISRFRRPVTKIQHSYESVVFSYIGCFFIFAYAPSINSQYLTDSPFQKSIVIMNTLLSMCCSVAASFATSIFIKKKISVIDIFNGSLCGCIGAGSSTGLFVNPCLCMILGALSGTVCVLGMEYLSGYLQRKLYLFDTFGIHNVRGLPGIIGGFGGAISIALSYMIPQDALKQLHYLTDKDGQTITRMVGYQIIGTFFSIIFSFICGLFTGYIITFVYNIDPVDFYKDNIYFELPQTALKQFKKKGAHIKKKQSFMDNNFLQFSSLSNTNDSTSYQIQSAYKQQNSSSKILQTQPFNLKLKKKITLPSLQKKLTFQQKIELTVQKLNHAPVFQQQVEHSEERSQINTKKGKITDIKANNIQCESQKDQFDKHMRIQRQRMQKNLQQENQLTNIQFQKTKLRILQVKPNQIEQKNNQQTNIMQNNEIINKNII